MNALRGTRSARLREAGHRPSRCRGRTAAPRSVALRGRRRFCSPYTWPWSGLTGVGLVETETLAAVCAADPHRCRECEAEAVEGARRVAAHDRQPAARIEEHAVLPGCEVRVRAAAPCLDSARDRLDPHHARVGEPGVGEVGGADV